VELEFAAGGRAKLHAVSRWHTHPKSMWMTSFFSCPSEFFDGCGAERMMNDDAQRVAQYCLQVLPLESARLADEYYYQSLSLCVIDAVFSIGVRYSCVQNVVSRYCQYFGVRQFRRNRTSAPPSCEEQESISSLLERFPNRGCGGMTEEVFKNWQRTSPVNGILKTEAVLEFADVLVKHRIEYFQHIPIAVVNDELEHDIRRIPGQTSGKSLWYFWMLAGEDGFAKPDRHILEFLKDALGRTVSAEQVQALLDVATDYLRFSFPDMTVRLLDNEIWKYQRERVNTRGPSRSHCKHLSREIDLDFGGI